MTCMEAGGEAGAVNGHPAWPGSASSKWMDRSTGCVRGLRAVPSKARDGDGRNLTSLGLGGFFEHRDEAGVRTSRRHLPTHPSETYEWTPMRRHLEEPGSRHPPERRGGIRQVAFFGGLPKPFPEKRHVRQVESKHEFGDVPQGISMVYRDNGLRAGDQPAKEVDLSHEMARKRVLRRLPPRRNDIGCASLGDKAYKHPEYSVGFHQAEGHTVGSTFLRGSVSRSQKRNAATWQSVGAEISGTRTGTLYKDARRERLKEEATLSVEALTGWAGQTLKECGIPYEEPDDSDAEREGAG